ncbi:MAG: hypothetical protein HYV36_06720 [Lentisphaerae bacterium]|nr:hypothetical protein [Lentisphaerota bacterium]
MARRHAQRVAGKFTPLRAGVAPYVGPQLAEAIGIMVGRFRRKRRGRFGEQSLPPWRIRLLAEPTDHVAFPLGGIGAGMLCLEGTGTLSHASLRHAPNIPGASQMFAALHIRGAAAVSRVLEGPIPARKIFGAAGASNGNILGMRFGGLPRFAAASFSACFPFATITLEDPLVPLQVEITGWSPFIPGDADNSSLPVAGLEYRLHNPGAVPVEAVFSFHSENVMKTDAAPDTAAQETRQGFILRQSGAPDKLWEQGAFSVAMDSLPSAVDCAWFRGGWFDALTMLWNTIEKGACHAKAPHADAPPSPGASVYKALTINPGKTETVVLRLCWHVPQSNLCAGKDAAAGSGCQSPANYSPWYAGRFPTIEAVESYWQQHYEELRQKSCLFASCFYDTTLPAAVVEAVAANLTILKSPTILRQSDGRLWAWEGCGDSSGCCHGSCTHVWNYAQALPHLFPDLERSLRQTEFQENQNQEGHQQFRATLPIRANTHDFHAAADGQLGGIIKVYREWRIFGDTSWLRTLWPRVKASLDYCIRQWDPARKGVLEEPHHNTYDIEFWGPDGMCSSIYLGALKAAMLMGQALQADVSLYQDLLGKGQRYLEQELFNGEYFEQRVEWRNLKTPQPAELAKQGKGVSYSAEALEILANEGPNYQYGQGCLSDGVLGAWLAAVSGLGDILDRKKVERHLRAVYRYNFKRDLSRHTNPQRPGYAVGREGGLLLCTWPKGGKPSLPFVYSDEVWTGIEYQVASHLMMMGRIRDALAIVRACRSRYDGTVRNPFNEYECGHWYARAMSSYALLQGVSGARYDAVDKVLHLHPRIKGDFRAFLATATGFGSVGLRAGQPFLDVKYGSIPVTRIDFAPWPLRSD